jgi:hypothetical protein
VTAATLQPLRVFRASVCCAVIAEHGGRRRFGPLRDPISVYVKGAQKFQQATLVADGIRVEALADDGVVGAVVKQ